MKIKELVNQFLKSREIWITFNNLNSHFGKNWNYNKYPYGNIMIDTNSNKIVGFMATIYSHIDGKEYLCCNLAHF